MKRHPFEISKERRRVGESWDNEGGNQSSNVPPSEEKNGETARKTDRGVVEPISEERTRKNSRTPPTQLSSTYFMTLWNAGTRTVRRHRLSERRSQLSINPDNLRRGKEAFRVLARDRGR